MEKLEEMIFFGEIPQQNMRNSVKFRSNSTVDV